MLVSRSLGALGTAVLAGVILAGCSTQANRAPVEDRGQSASSSSSVDVKSLPGAENAGKPGYYTIKPGDTLIKVGLEHGQSWKDIARWSNLDNPNVIEVGQVVRVVPPGRDAPVASSGSGRSVAPVVVGGGSTATSSSATTTPLQRQRPCHPRLQPPCAGCQGRRRCEFHLACQRFADCRLR